MQLSGRVALVTGGAGGIGAAVVRALVQGGVAAVAINYRKSSKEAEALAVAIEQGGGKRRIGCRAIRAIGHRRPTDQLIYLFEPGLLVGCRESRISHDRGSY